MRRRRTVFILAAVLVIEAVVIVAIPARVPRAARVLTALVNVIAAAALLLYARQNRDH